MIARMKVVKMSVRLAYLPEGWNGPGIYGDFSGCGHVTDIDGVTALEGSEFQGHVHELPVMQVGSGLDADLAELLGLPVEAATQEDIDEAMAETISALNADFAWPEEDITVLSAEEFEATVPA
jgi:hypothetical protein